MRKTSQHRAGDSAPAARRDERDRETKTEEQQLGRTVNDRRGDPKLPHERDESAPDADTANAAAAPGNEVMRRAFDDLEQGRQDTDRGPVLDSTYHELRKNGRKP
ncbi:MAG TPA: hypothetical protein VJ743_13290 [Albitalea sp.]|nr:hypothetical protein [Albitalea sp.]